MGASETCAREGLDLLDIGIAIFDTESRLVYANPPFRALRRYPDEICHEGVTLESLLQFNAQHGDFGAGNADAQVAERLSEIRQAAEREIERTMADGQILRIRYRSTGSDTASPWKTRSVSMPSAANTDPVRSRNRCGSA